MLRFFYNRKDAKAQRPEFSLRLCAFAVKIDF